MKNFVAAVDMGTNSFHLVIAEGNEEGSFKIIDREREVIRLGSQEGNNLNHISEDEIDRAVKILKKFKDIAENYGTDLRAVATSAVREADNKELFLDTVKKSLDLSVEVIEGSREAKLIFNGASKALGLSNKNILCIDIGGGSTEFIYAEKDKILFAESIKIGAVRLSKKFFTDYFLTDENIRQCRNFVEEKIRENPAINLNVNAEFAVGSSGTIQAAAGMIHFNKYNSVLNIINGYKFNKNELEFLSQDILSKKSSAERLKIKGLEKKRTDIMPAGLIILQKIFDLFNFNEMIVSEFALREGIIIDSLKKKLKNSQKS